MHLQELADVTQHVMMLSQSQAASLPDSALLSLKLSEGLYYRPARRGETAENALGLGCSYMLLRLLLISSKFTQAEGSEFDI